MFFEALLKTNNFFTIHILTDQHYKIHIHKDISIYFDKNFKNNVLI